MNVRVDGWDVIDFVGLILFEKEVLEYIASKYNRYIVSY